MNPTFDFILGELLLHKHNSSDVTPIGDNTVVLLGDSITAQNFETGTGSHSMYGGFSWGNAMLGHPFEVIYNAGIGGNRTDQMIARLSTDVLSYNPSYVCVLAGTNDLIQNVDSSVIISNLSTIYSTIIDNNINLIACTIPPATSTYTGSKKTAYFQVNNWIRSYCISNNILFVDLEAAFIDYSSSDISAISGATTDGLHPSASGAQRLGQVFYNYLKNKTPLGLQFANSKSDQNLKLLLNPLLDGTTGSKTGSGVSGDVATSWTVAGDANNVVCSKIAINDLSGKQVANWQQFLKGGVKSEFAIQQSLSSGFAAGETYQAQCKIELDSDVTELRGVKLVVEELNSGFSTVQQKSDLYYAPVFATDASLIKSPLVLKTPKITFTSAVYRVFVRAYFYYATGTCRIRNIELRKV